MSYIKTRSSVDWDYFDKFTPVIFAYMPSRGEGDTMASQIVTAVNKLIYKWYNDGDVYDNTHHLKGWCNDLSSYANWLSKYAVGTRHILDSIEYVYSYGEYETLLADLADLCLNEAYLSDYNRPNEGTIYNCDGKFVFREDLDGDTDDDWEDDDRDG